ncbi:hypothetical protein jhhlp_004930 [Lomentospora prolificans]|uniref:Uncharacterized protein n=1 Tax=Lomentospora prolificans TaxID=41688 RepID=A0A2N3N820_9PEZI|nr:hypothetical protein jhhlp_004930 [Lomentospora prolificans]
MSNDEKQQQQNYEVDEASDEDNTSQERQPQALQKNRRRENDPPMHYRDPAEGKPGRERVRKTRIQDREKSDAEDSSLKIKIELDLEAEINLYARVKGDVTIGLLYDNISSTTAVKSAKGGPLASLAIIMISSIISSRFN